MLRLNKKELAQLESQYSGIIEQIMRFENAVLPPCPHCGSNNIADVQVGVIGRTMNIAAATSKFRLLMNGPKPGDYVCNDCNKFFNQQQTNKKRRKPKAPGGFTLSRPEDKSLDAFKRWINDMVKALGGDESDDMTEEEWQEKWKKFWSN